MSAAGDEDRRWLDSAVRYARPWLGTTGGQPTDAALVVDESEGLVFGRAVTGEGGAPSAIAAALMEAGDTARGRTLYVTMEPGTDDTEELIAAGVGRIVIGILDPDLAWRGRAVARFDEMGIDVAIAEHGPARDLHAAYIHRVTYGRPHVTLVLAVSRDGMIARRDGLPANLPGAQARRWLDLQRATSDAVMTGAGWVEAHGLPRPASLSGFGERPCRRVVVTGSAPLSGQVDLTLPAGSEIYLIAPEGSGLELAGASMIAVPARSGRPDLRHALSELAARDVSSLLVEGGARLTEAMLGAELAHRFWLIASPLEIGREGVPATALGTIEGRLHAAGFSPVEVRDLGPDRLGRYERRL
ncbi:MAG TPA: hypothetical protein GYA10_17020 [Alphaproteobacteria bacterium]|nr:hypothetical protein [Alphaproteobacteria bacterium]